MKLIKQDVFFEGLNFQKCSFDNRECYKGLDNSYFRVDHFSSYYVVESAANEMEASNNQFEDDDTFDDSLPEAELILQIQAWLRKYSQEE